MKSLLNMNSHNFYVMIGTFAIVFMVYLWVAPKLIKKPAGTPPRSGSNEEKKQIAKTIAGVPPAPTTDQKEGKAPSPGVGTLPPMTQVTPSAASPSSQKLGMIPADMSNPIYGSKLRLGNRAFMRASSASLYPFNGLHFA